jgi:hypothetical protein
MGAAEKPTAESLLSTLRTIAPAERAKHEVVLDYWLSIRGDKEFPPLHDLDPLEISDAGPCSILLELIGGGQDAEIRHLGEALQGEAGVQRIIDAPNPSILACIAKKLPIVAISRDFLAFEDSFNGADGPTRCWVTLLPLSSCGSWVDYVYAFVSANAGKAAAKPKPEEATEAPEAEIPAIEEEALEAAHVETEEPVDVIPFAEVEPESEETAETLETPESAEIEPEPESLAEDPAPKAAPGFSKLLEGVANLAGFYGQGVKADPVVNVELSTDETDVASQATDPDPPEAAAVELEAVEPEASQTEPFELEAVDQPNEESVAVEPLDLELPPNPDEHEVEQTVDESVDEQPADEAQEENASEQAPVMEGTLQKKLAEVQAKADEAREAQLRATQALHAGLSAAYDFALEAENRPEEYLRMVESQGLKIQLRAPMAPVAKLAFDGVCDTATIRQFEAVLAWALKVELPRGALLERIEQAGGIPELLNEFARAA